MEYQGPATLTLDNGDTIDVTADLYSLDDGALREWRGTVTGDPHRLFDAHAARGNLRVVLPNGSSGAALLSHVDIGSDVAELTGSGPPPNPDSD